jgi:hypothetical protein
MQKKTYAAPTMTRYGSVAEMPAHLKSCVLDILAAQVTFSVTIDDERRYVAVPEEFGKLLGYEAKEIIGKSVDDLTPSGVIDVESVHQEFLRLGELHGFWVFAGHDGKKLLIRFYATKGKAGIDAQYTPLFIAA